MAKVLVVEDDPDVRRLVEMKLKLDGIETLTATNGQEALDLLTVEKVDLVVLDLMMPVMGGASRHAAPCRRMPRSPTSRSSC